MYLVRKLYRKGQIIFNRKFYCPPDSRNEYNDKFEDFMDKDSSEGKEIILMGDFNKKKICTDHCDTYWLNVTLSLGSHSMVKSFITLKAGTMQFLYKIPYLVHTTGLFMLGLPNFLICIPGVT